MKKSQVMQTFAFRISDHLLIKLWSMKSQNQSCTYQQFEDEREFWQECRSFLFTVIYFEVRRIDLAFLPLDQFWS